MKRSFTFLLLLLFTVSSFSVVLALDEVAVGDTLNVVADNKIIQYEIQLEEGQVIEVRATTDDFDAYLALNNDDNEMIASDDDSGEGLNPYLVYEVPVSGRYIINIGAFPHRSRATGEFELQINDISNVEDVESEISWGRDVTCDTGEQIDSGVEVVVSRQESGKAYHITAIGLDGFDPILAVTLKGNYEAATCNDNDSEAATYRADLPTTGAVDSSESSSQVIFNLESDNELEDISIIVSGATGESGEYLLIIEGLAYTDMGLTGERIFLREFSSLFTSDIAPTAYMLAIEGNSLDPFLYLADERQNAVQDAEGNRVECDNAGNAGSCMNVPEDLTSSFISLTGGNEQFGGRDDAMVTLPVNQDYLTSPLDDSLNIIMGSFGTTGEFVAAFHLGIASE